MTVPSIDVIPSEARDLGPAAIMRKRPRSLASLGMTMRLGMTMALGAIWLSSCTTSAPEPIPVIIAVPVAAPSPPPRNEPKTTAPTPPASTQPSQPPGPPTVLRTPSRSRVDRDVRDVRDAGDTTIRVLLTTNSAPRVASPGGLMFSRRDGSFAGRAARNDVWRIERSGHLVRAVNPDGAGTPWVEAPLYARPIGGALLSVGGKPYRGDLALYASDTNVVVVNVVKIDDYLRGVVPLEIGTKAMEDSAAVQAQAVTARSYAYIHLSRNPSRLYDVTAGVTDQVYGGVEVETAVASEAVEATRTLVLRYAGRVVNAPYHSTCGGTTASASEVWRSNDEPYLRAVSDQIPGTGRSYCDIAPRYRWTRTIDAGVLNAALGQYLATYTTVPNRTPGAARGVTVGSHTASGRVGTVTVSTDRGNFLLRGNDIRFVLRPVGGEILNSTSFSVESNMTHDGSLTRVTIRGLGYGHGVGMCQWGAIGRARAGQDFRTILRTYYPGTSIGPAN